MGIIEEEDLDEMANEKVTYNGETPNPNYTKGSGYQTNCQSCVVAYELRLRGYKYERGK